MCAVAIKFVVVVFVIARNCCCCHCRHMRDDNKYCCCYYCSDCWLLLLLLSALPCHCHFCAWLPTLRDYASARKMEHTSKCGIKSTRKITEKGEEAACLQISLWQRWNCDLKYRRSIWQRYVECFMAIAVDMRDSYAFESRNKGGREAGYQRYGGGGGGNVKQQCRNLVRFGNNVSVLRCRRSGSHSDNCLNRFGIAAITTTTTKNKIRRKKKR